MSQAGGDGAADIGSAGPQRRVPRIDLDGDPGALFVRHKYVVPRPVAAATGRPRLVSPVVHADVVFVVAPYGYGKTTFAQEVARHHPGPVAWYTADETDRTAATVVAYALRALGEAWGDVSGYVTAGNEDSDAAYARLSYVLDELVGPATIVLDDLHALPEDVARPLLRTLVRSLPPRVSLVVCSRRTLPVNTIEMEAAGRAVGVGAGELCLTRSEVEELLDGARHHVEHVVDASGGWPLAVGLLAQRIRAGRDVYGDSARAELARPLLEGLSEAAQDALAAMSNVPAVPSTSVLALVSEGTAGELIGFAEANPVMLSVEEDGWWSVHDLLRDAMRPRGVRGSLSASLANEMAKHGQAVLALHLLESAGLWQEARVLLERQLVELVWSGRWEQLRDLVSVLPHEHRGPLLGFALALVDSGDALETLGYGVELGPCQREELRRRHDEVWSSGAQQGLLASGMLSILLAAQGDVRAFDVALWALRGLCGRAVVLEEGLSSLVYDVSAEGVDLVALPIQAIGYVLLFTGQPDAVEQGRRLFRLSQKALVRGGRWREAEALAGVQAATDVFLGGAPYEEALERIELSAGVLRDRWQSVALGLLDSLARLRVRVGDLAGARHVCEEILAWSELSDSSRISDRYRMRARQLRVLVDVASGAGADDMDTGMEAVWAEGISAIPHSMPEWAAELAHALLDAGDVGRARLWSLRIERIGIPIRPYVRVDREAIGARLAIFDGDVAGALGEVDAILGRAFPVCSGANADFLLGRVALDLIRTGRAADARDVLARVTSDLPLAWRTRIQVALGEAPDAFEADCTPLRVGMLSPEILLERGDRSVAPPKGYGARLLALLVTTRGRVEVDAAIEVLWPEIDPDVGRKRMRCVLHRLRRALGFGPEGPLVVDEGLIRLDPGNELSVDVWEFEDLDGDSPDLEQALRLYGDDFCSRQFAYDEFAVDARRRLRNRFVRLVSRFLGDRVEAKAVTEGVQDLAYHAWSLVPDDEALCAAAMGTLIDCGRRREAARMLAETLRVLEDIGIPAEEFRTRGEAVLASG